MSVSKFNFLIYFLFSILIFSNCDNKLENENLKLKQKLSQLETELDSLKSIISDLQQTDNYYYQMGVKSRHNEEYKKSNLYFEKLIDKFPKSNLLYESKKLIKKNNENLSKSLYEEALSLQNSGNYTTSNEYIDKLINEFPKSNLIYKAKRLKSKNLVKIKQKREAELKSGSDLELITWSWGTTSTGNYVEAKGQVRNISGKTLKNVTAVVSFYDKNGNFITSDNALIDFNPILSGQTSPFSVSEQYNPAMHSANIQFKFLMGGTISTYRKSKK